MLLVVGCCVSRGLCTEPLHSDGHERASGIRWLFAIIMLMELVPEPDYDNVVFIDEYPEIEERLRLQRLARPAVRQALHDMRNILVFERPDTPDGAA